MPRKRRAKSLASPIHAAAPPQEFAQHHDVDARQRAGAGDEGWRVRTRLDALLAAGRIGAAEWQAGTVYRTAVEHGELGGRIGEGGGGDGCPTTARLLALRRLADARAVLTVQQRMAMDGVAADRSWPQIGVMLGRTDKTAQAWAIEALKLLADHYRLRGKKAAIRTLAA